MNDSEDELLESDTLTSCKRSDFGTWMQLLFWVVLILFSIVKTKILHYSSLAYFPLTYLGALTLWRAIRWNVYPRVVSFWSGSGGSCTRNTGSSYTAGRNEY
jgi:hypothetical protein